MNKRRKPKRGEVSANLREDVKRISHEEVEDGLCGSKQEGAGTIRHPHTYLKPTPPHNRVDWLKDYGTRLAPASRAVRST